MYGKPFSQELDINSSYYLMSNHQPQFICFGGIRLFIKSGILFRQNMPLICKETSNPEWRTVKFWQPSHLSRLLRQPPLPQESFPALQKEVCIMQASAHSSQVTDPNLALVLDSLSKGFIKSALDCTLFQILVYVLALFVNMSS